ncbi:DinB family protein, partial [Deinococcus sp. 6GRE01]|uniref:DinB family protein n=1 Tax=Deinococcus sp. 6GRE01 TaxID=2745873 RepID=UPI001E601AB5
LAWEDLDTRWAQSRAGLERAAAELRHTPGRTLWHPFFGELDAMDWMRMVAIHLNNHRKQLEASANA